MPQKFRVVPCMYMLYVTLPCVSSLGPSGVLHVVGICRFKYSVKSMVILFAIDHVD